MERYQATRKLIDRPWDYIPDRTIRETDILIIRCRRSAEGEPIIERADGKTFAPLEQALVYHSPTGMEFGYGGSGPADLALNILGLIVTPAEAGRLHQRFKNDVLAHAFPAEGGALAMQHVRSWVEAYWHEEIQRAPARPAGDDRRYDAEQEIDEAGI